MFSQAIQLIMEPQTLSAAVLKAVQSDAGQTDTGIGATSDITWLSPVGWFALGGNVADPPDNVGTTTKVDLKSWGFAIPTEAIIKGIRHDYRGNGSLSYLGKLFDHFQLLKSSSPVGDIKTVSVVPANPFIYGTGGQTDLWGTTWTPAEINSANFGIRWQVENITHISGGWSRYLEDFTMTVYYEI